MYAELWSKVRGSMTSSVVFVLKILQKKSFSQENQMHETWQDVINCKIWMLSFAEVFYLAQWPQLLFMVSHDVTNYVPFFFWVVFYYVYEPHFLCSFVSWWILTLFPFLHLYEKCYKPWEYRSVCSRLFSLPLDMSFYKNFWFAWQFCFWLITWVYTRSAWGSRWCRLMHRPVLAELGPPPDAFAGLCALWTVP